MLLAKSYETIYILKPDLNEEVTLNTIKKYQKFLYTNQCRDIVVYDRGRRHLSYPIKKYHDGVYVQINYKANSKIVSLLDKSFKIDESVIRYSTVKEN
uniref:30S ribosomal protein S6, chloroplastic n=1 Tax=Bangiopsis subsimplex TaxID=139980 RepID=A0A1C9CCV1_9RHOD|nr:ribosomal protein S6 [Bangiopsis subsimplex]AOM66223.1 ribosomal protein S6 [Bangiopsis subsimplex]ARO90416.1 30S ribosomal protein S6 [Bangiopsis subsimplex]